MNLAPRQMTLTNLQCLESRQIKSSQTDMLLLATDAPLRLGWQPFLDRHVLRVIKVSDKYGRTP